jgi:hypothetical protein
MIFEKLNTNQYYISSGKCVLPPDPASHAPNEARGSTPAAVEGGRGPLANARNLDFNLDFKLDFKLDFSVVAAGTA